MTDRLLIRIASAALACAGLAFALAPAPPGPPPPPDRPQHFREATPEETLRWELEHARDMRHAAR